MLELVNVVLLLIILAGVGAWLFKARPLARLRLRRDFGDIDVVADLDALMVQPVGFRYAGNIFHVKPMQLQEFLRVTNALARLDKLRVEKVKSEKELQDAYQGLFDVAIVEKLDASKMHAPQAAVVLNIVNECVMGKAQLGYEKKSRLAMEKTRQVQANQVAS